MTCLELRARLDAYAAGTLAVADARAFEDHVERCAECGSLLERSEPAPGRLESLPRTVQPEADLWPAIQARLAPRRPWARRVTMPGWGLAAAALLLIALSSAVTVVVFRRTAPPAAALASARMSPLEARYAAATAELAAALEQARPRLGPATVATIERNIAVIDDALAEARRALASDPDNADLEQLVLAAWRQKLDFLRRATALSTAL